MTCWQIKKDCTWKLLYMCYVGHITTVKEKWSPLSFCTIPKQAPSRASLRFSVALGLVCFASRLWTHILLAYNAIDCRSRGLKWFIWFSYCSSVNENLASQSITFPVWINHPPPTSLILQPNEDMHWHVLFALYFKGIKQCKSGVGVWPCYHTAINSTL